jgi:hypothetical protein
LYGCENWSLTLREEHGVRVFENKVLRRISGPNRDKVTGEWRKLHNEKLHNLYSSPNIIRQIKLRRMRWGTKGRGEKIVQGFGGKTLKERGNSEDKGIDGRKGSERILGRLAGEDMKWIQFSQKRDWWWAAVNAVMNFWVLTPEIVSWLVSEG